VQKPRYDSSGQETGGLSELRFILILIGLAAVVRLAFYLAAYQTPLFHAPMVDEAWHDEWARELLENGWRYPQVFFRAPLYPYALSLLYAVSGESIAFARAFQLLVSCASIVVFYLLARRLAPLRVARIAAIVLCFYGTMIWYEQALLLPVAEVFLDLVLLALLLRYDRAGSVRTLIAAGLVAGLSIVTRPNLGLFLIGAVWLLLRREEWATEWNARIRRVLLFTAACALPVLPVTLHNYWYSGDLIPVSSQGGINFYLGNNPKADGLTMIMPELPIDESMTWDRFVPATDSVARKLSGRYLSEGEISAFWSERFWRYVITQPGSFTLGLLKKTYFFFAGAENSDNFDLYFYRQINPVYAALVWRWGIHFPFGIVAPLALAGMCLLWSKRRELRWLYLFVLLYAPTVIGVLVTARHRLPVLPVLVLFAVWGATILWSEARAWNLRRRLVWGVALAALLVGTNLELFGLGLQNDRQSHVNLALAHQKLSQPGPMVEHFDAALAIDSGSVVALNGRGVAYLTDGDVYMAKQMFRLALSLEPQSMEIRNNLALVLMRQGSWESARLLYAEVIAQAGDMAEPYHNLALLFAAIGQPDSALAFYDSALVRDSQYVQALNNKGSLLVSLGDSTGAVECWRKALGIDPGYDKPAINVVRWLRDRRVLDSAQAVLEAAKSPFRRQSDWYYWSALVATDLGDREKAADLVSEAMRLFPDDRTIKTLSATLRPAP